MYVWRFTVNSHLRRRRDSTIESSCVVSVNRIDDATQKCRRQLDKVR